MAAPRLPFLWPMLARNVEAATPTVRSARAAARIRAFHPSSHPRRPDAVSQRYGTANEPPPHLGGGKGLGPSTTTTKKPAASDPPPQPKALPKIGEQLQRDGEAEVKAEQAQQKNEPAIVDGSTPGPILSDPALDAAESEATEKPPGSPRRPEDRPMETLLNSVSNSSINAEAVQTPPSSKASSEKAAAAAAAASAAASAKGEEQQQQDNTRTAAESATEQPAHKAPHIDTPRHVHHFDTYGLVRRLVDAGWSDKQAVTIMKAVRLMLAANMELAREALVSKSQVENETYLFRAACAELKTEVTGRRKAEQEKMRTERTGLQHELDILSQRVGQEAGALKDELKGMFDDRKMAVRNEQREMESKIQRLNYQITVELQADGKSEVEGLRWVMTRRVIIALGVVVIMVVGSLKIYSNTVHEQETESKRRMAGHAAGTAAAPADLALRAEGSGGGEMLVKEGDNPAFVSLG